MVDVLLRIDPGDVITYGEVAEEAGFPGAARAVGNLLKKSDGLPWWRVVGADGYLKTAKREDQAQLLRAEGVMVNGGRVHSNKRRNQIR